MFIVNISTLSKYVDRAVYSKYCSCEDELITRIGECSYGEQLKLVNEQLEYHTITGMSALDFLSDDDFRCYASTQPSGKVPRCFIF